MRHYSVPFARRCFLCCWFHIITIIVIRRENTTATINTINKSPCAAIVTYSQTLAKKPRANHSVRPLPLYSFLLVLYLRCRAVSNPLAFITRKYATGYSVLPLMLLSMSVHLCCTFLAIPIFTSRRLPVVLPM